MLLGLDVCVPVGVEVEDGVPDLEDVDDADEDDELLDDVVRDLLVEEGELVTVWVVGALLVELE